MFGDKAAEIERLTAENAALAAQIEQQETDPYYGMAQDIRASVEAVVATGDHIDPRITEIIEEHRQAAVAAEIERAGAEEAKRRIKAAKGEIDAEVEVEADKLAQEALAHFWATGAEDYRAKRREALANTKGDALIRAAQGQIYEAERQAAIDDLVAKRAREDDYRDRAPKIRAETKTTEVLEFSDLHDGDELTVAFTSPDKARESFRDNDGYSPRYKHELERRKLSFKLVDRATGLVEIIDDSWGDSDQHRPLSFRGGQQIKVLAKNPLSTPHRNAPIIVKCEPVIFQSASSRKLPCEELAVWWVELGEFRVLS